MAQHRWKHLKDTARWRYHKCERCEMRRRKPIKHVAEIQYKNRAGHESGDGVEPPCLNFKDVIGREPIFISH